MLNVLLYLGAFQYASIGLINVAKKSYIQANFKDYKEEDLFISKQSNSLTIKNQDDKLSKVVYLPILGIFKIPVLIIKSLDELSSYHKVENQWDLIKREELFTNLYREYQRLNVSTKSIELAKELIEMNLHTEVVVSSTELLYSTLKMVVLDDDNTGEAIYKTIDEYYSVLFEIKNSPNVVDLKTLSNTQNIFNSIKSDIKNSNALF